MAPALTECKYFQTPTPLSNLDERRAGVVVAITYTVAATTASAKVSLWFEVRISSSPKGGGVQVLCAGYVWPRLAEGTQ